MRLLPPNVQLCVGSRVLPIARLSRMLVEEQSIVFDAQNLRFQPAETAEFFRDFKQRPGELYMMCQGAGGGYGDVIKRDAAAVIKDIEEDLISHGTAQDIYKVVFDSSSLVVDEEATCALRDAERKARIARGEPFDEFCSDCVTPEPPAHLPYFGSWDDPTQVYGVSVGQRLKMDADKLVSMFMLNPKDVQIAKLDAELKAVRAELAQCRGAESEGHLP